MQHQQKKHPLSAEIQLGMGQVGLNTVRSVGRVRGEAFHKDSSLKCAVSPSCAVPQSQNGARAGDFHVDVKIHSLASLTVIPQIMLIYTDCVK